MYDFRNSWEFPGILTYPNPKEYLLGIWKCSLKFYFCNISRLCIPSHPQGHCSDRQTFVISSDLVSQTPDSSSPSSTLHRDLSKAKTQPVIWLWNPSLAPQFLHQCFSKCILGQWLHKNIWQFLISGGLGSFIQRFRISGSWSLKICIHIFWMISLNPFYGEIQHEYRSHIKQRYRLVNHN